MDNNGLHKTEEGLNKILLIKRNMNSIRIMKTKQLPFWRNKFFKSFENGSKDQSFLHYAYLVGLFEGDGFLSI
jgi:hypothetical protein